MAAYRSQIFERIDNNIFLIQNEYTNIIDAAVLRAVIDANRSACKLILWWWPPCKSVGANKVCQRLTLPISCGRFCRKGRPIIKYSFHLFRRPPQWCWPDESLPNIEIFIIWSFCIYNAWEDKLSYI